jgi:hypothetical protein
MRIKVDYSPDSGPWVPLLTDTESTELPPSVKLEWHRSRCKPEPYRMEQKNRRRWDIELITKMNEGEATDCTFGLRRPKVLVLWPELGTVR